MTSPSHSSLPVLHSDRLDWVEASYESLLAVGQSRVTVEHRLDCTEIAGLIADGAASYAVESRCPRTMFSRTDLSAGTRQQIDVTVDMAEDSLFLLPGVVAVSPCSLPAAGLHKMLRTGRRSVEIPVGWWLARGGEFSYKPVIAQLLAFVRDDGLEDGTMTVDEDTSSADLKFRVSLAADLHARRLNDRDIHIAALAGAFGRLRDSNSDRDGSNSQAARQLRTKLEDLVGTDWDSPDFDPLRAASFWEPFAVPPEDDEEAA